MNTKLNLAVLTITGLLAFSCGGNKNKTANSENKDSLNQFTLTVRNLEDVFNETNNSKTKYTAFSEKATEEQLSGISLLFNTAAASEDIHEKNIVKILNESGLKPIAEKDSLKVNTTAENLKTILSVDKEYLTKQYRSYIDQAKNDENSGASKAFSWTVETRLKLISYFQEAYDALSKSKEKSLPAVYYICPKCGFVYYDGDITDNCELCGTEKDKFITVK